jgi:hypothetical protein
MRRIYEKSKNEEALPVPLLDRNISKKFIRGYSC